MPIADPSISGTPPPINNLTNDVLFFIFSINADMTDESLWWWDDNKISYRALHVTRRTSQVSRYWRKLILGSPTIWAGVIDLDLFRPSLESWREEVFQRCGKCLLSVKGLCSFQRDAPETSIFTDKDALIKFFDTYWDQIKNLHVEVTYAHLVDDETWLRILRLPARFLCSFNLQLHYYDEVTHQLFPSSHNPDATLFSSVAPALRRFYHDPTISILALRPPWLSQLRVLELNFTQTQTPPTTIIQVLDLLENLHILEVLKISMGHSSPEPHTDKRLRPIEFPRLHRLSLKCTNLHDCIYFLEHITPRKGCSISLYSLGSMFFEPTDEKCAEKVASLAEHFSIYAKGLDWHDAQVLSLRVSTHSFEFTTYSKSWKDNSDFLDSSDNFYIKLKVEIYNSGLRQGVDFLPFLCSIPSSLFDFIKLFDLDFPDDNCFTRAPRPQFHDFLASLLSVGTLIASNHTVFRLLQCSSKFTACFPSLHTLHMRHLENYGVSTFQNNIMDFLRWRTECARGIEVLDFTLSYDAYEHEFGFLEEMTGLKVRWGLQYLDEAVHEYVCGTGSPETLDLNAFARMEADLMEAAEFYPYDLEFEGESDENRSWEDDSEWSS